MEIPIFFQIITALSLGHSSLSTGLIPALAITAVIANLTGLGITSQRRMVHWIGEQRRTRGEMCYWCDKTLAL